MCFKSLWDADTCTEGKCGVNAENADFKGFIRVHLALVSVPY